MIKRLFLPILGLCISSLLLAEKTSEKCNIEILIADFLSQYSSCDIKVEVDKVVLISEMSQSYPEIQPKIMPSDLQVLVQTMSCNNSDKYYFWLRESEKGDYSVVSYTSFSQPE